ncbi:MAG TPA: beta-galactosidase, partial [Gemmataceae bacterium]
MRRTPWLTLLLLWTAPAFAADWAPKAAPLMTRWAKDVDPAKPHPEYPRPTMVRPDWQNLNGLWDYAIRPKAEGKPDKFDGKILVPFPVESALSGVMKQVGPDNRLWYRRTFTVPAKWSGKTLLHFGACDWDTTVWVNGKELGKHQGGYDPFSFDITDALKSGEQEMIVGVWDPSDAGPQPRGKQVRRPGGIWYTPTTGIWQTVWLEPVPTTSIESLKIVPDLDAKKVIVSAVIRGGKPGLTLNGVAMKPGHAEAAGTAHRGPADGPIELTFSQVEPWSPESPTLYDLRVVLLDGEKPLDEVRSYVAIRKSSLGKDEHGVTRLMLNDKPVFQFGPLDQGFWPDGLYTAPTDEALKYDIEITKKLGFNMTRKHVKVEPARWYYWCDKLGLLVWQDMPSGDRSVRSGGGELKRTPESARIYERELKA